MDGARFDRLAAAWARGHSRRGVLALLSALAIGGRGALEQEAVAQKAGAERVSCRGRCEDGQVCKHGACLDPLANPGTCTPDSNGPPRCGPAGGNCAAVALRSGEGYCLSASKSTPEGDGCISRGCRRNGDCAKGQVCAHVPGCCPDKTKPGICAVPCPVTTCLGFREACSSPDECCAADQTTCAPNNVVVGEDVCCSTLGGACTEGGPSGDCCAVPAGSGSDYAYCSPGGACGGTGAVCRFNDVCVSGVCCKVNPSDDQGTCCQSGQTCTAGACAG